MKPVPSLQQFVEQLAHKYGLDWRCTGAYLRLQMQGHGHLVLENIGAARISLTHYVSVGNDLMADPEVVLYTGFPSNSGEGFAWAPMEINQVFGSWRLYAELDLQANLIVHDPVGQAELAHFCEQVLAKNLVRHGWLTAAQRANLARPLWTDTEIYARDIRLDEIP